MTIDYIDDNGNQSSMFDFVTETAGYEYPFPSFPASFFPSFRFFLLPAFPPSLLPSFPHSLLPSSLTPSFPHSLTLTLLSLSPPSLPLFIIFHIFSIFLFPYFSLILLDLGMALLTRKTFVICIYLYNIFYKL